ncbi:hypothetical protein [Rhodanobacter sp. B04]|uniref:hypothetical protein n=1 Tax=Rhodanobacter sp. B04 TaxID=1945860 RepID=UPI0009856357|nr:hypothetical protein [Rhodanobacter sp. B04]
MLLDQHLKQRNEREPKDYASQILDSVTNSLIKLEIVQDEKQFIDELFNPMVSVVHKGCGGDELYEFLSDETNIPQGKEVNNRKAWAQIAIAYCVQALRASDSGDLTAAWTYVVDARFAADAVLSSILDRAAAISARSNVGRIGVAAKLANDPVQAAKAEAKKLWLERYAGEHPKLRTNEQFAIEVMRRWPALKSSKVICGWCTMWNKEVKSKPAS